MAIVYLSLGSNIGDRLGYVQQAASLIGTTENIKIVTTSSFYETEPWQMNTKNWFVNAIVQISTTYTPDELLQVIQRIEDKLGRKRDKKAIGYQDRTIDIDILFYDSIMMHNEMLTIPHPLLHRRACLLVPMLEIAQDFVHPLFEKTISQLYDELEEPEQVFLYGTRV